MKPIAKQIIVFVLFLISSISFSQSVETPEYILKGNTIKYADSDTQIPIASTFSKSSNTLTWKQEVNKTNSSVTEFAISNTTGDFNTESLIGNQIHTLDIPGYEASFHIIGTTSGVSAVLKIEESRESGQEQKYTFENITITHQ